MKPSETATFAGEIPPALWTGGLFKPGMRALALAGLLLSGGTAALRADDWAPPQRGIERYEHIWKTSPFVAIAEVNPQSESLASRYAVTGFARVGANEVVFVLDRKGLTRFSLSKDQPKNGVELVSLQNSGDLKTLGATIRSGGEVAVIACDVSAPDPNAQAVAPNPAGAGNQSQVVKVSSQPAAPGSEVVPRPNRIIKRKTITVQ
ncbi:MAG: hypothetical protein ACOYMS_12415 [Terrimicrobiaceae bacterium]